MTGSDRHEPLHNLCRSIYRSAVMREHFYCIVRLLHDVTFQHPYRHLADVYGSRVTGRELWLTRTDCHSRLDLLLFSSREPVHNGGIARRSRIWERGLCPARQCRDGTVHEEPETTVSLDEFCRLNRSRFAGRMLCEWSGLAQIHSPA